MTDEPAARPSSDRTLLAGDSEGEARPVIVTSEPPLKSMPGLRPTVPSSAAELMTMIAAIVYQMRRLAMKGMEVVPE